MDDKNWLEKKRYEPQPPKFWGRGTDVHSLASKLEKPKFFVYAAYSPKVKKILYIGQQSPSTNSNRVMNFLQLYLAYSYFKCIIEGKESLNVEKVNADSLSNIEIREKKDKYGAAPFKFLSALREIAKMAKIDEKCKDKGKKEVFDHLDWKIWIKKSRSKKKIKRWETEHIEKLLKVKSNWLTNTQIGGNMKVNKKKRR